MEGQENNANKQLEQLKLYVNELKNYIEVLVTKNKELESKIEKYETNNQISMEMGQEEQQQDDNPEYPTLTIHRKKRKKIEQKSTKEKEITPTPTTTTEVAKDNNANSTAAAEETEKRKITTVGNKPNPATVITQPINNGKKEKVPPIVAYNINTKSIINKLNEAIGNKSFILKKINKNVTHVVTKEINNFMKAMEIIKAENNQFYTYTPKEMKHETILLKGVDSSFDEEDIRGAFEELQVSQHILKISKYHTRKSIKENRELNIWLIQLKPNSDITVFTNIKYILHQSVSFERFVRTESIQCKNCQRYGHAASNCNMQYRCIKYSERTL